MNITIQKNRKLWIIDLKPSLSINHYKEGSVENSHNSRRTKELICKCLAHLNIDSFIWGRLEHTTYRFCTTGENFGTFFFHGSSILTYVLVSIIEKGRGGLWCLTPLSTIFQLYGDGQFYL